MAKMTKGGVLIKRGPKGIIDISNLKARDVEFYLKGATVDPKVARVLYQLAEGHNEMRVMVRDLLSTVEEMVDTVATIGLAVEGAHAKLAAMRREAMVDEETVTDFKSDQEG